jgi:hypothetical protein
MNVVHRNMSRDANATERGRIAREKEALIDKMTAGTTNDDDADDAFAETQMFVFRLLCVLCRLFGLVSRDIFEKKKKTQITTKNRRQRNASVQTLRTKFVFNC